MANRTDNFNRSNDSAKIGTPSDAGSDWVESASHGGIFGNQAYGAGGGAPWMSYLECGTGSGDGTVQVTYASTGGSAGLVFRASDASNWWVVRVIGGQFALYKNVSGSFSLVAGPTGTFSNGDQVSAVLSGSSITIKQNGTTLSGLNTTDSFNSTETKHGLGSQVADSSSLFDDWSFTGGAPATLTQGDPVVTSTTDTTNNLTAPVATGGTSPYTYQWKRATTANGSYSNVGTNSVTIADSSGLSAGTTYWYTITATDSAGSPQTATSFPVPAKLSGKALKVRVIGDSHWMQPDHNGGTNQAPLKFVSELGAWLSPRAVSLGGNSAAGGTKSADWIPGASGTPLENAVSAANSSGDNIYIVQLGSNDSTNGAGIPVTPATYGSNIALIVNYIKANATGTPLIIALIEPFYYTDPSAFDSTTIKDHIETLFEYAAQLESLCDGVTVFKTGLSVRYQIPTAATTYLDTDLLHLKNPDGQNLSGKNAADDLAAQLTFGSSGTGGGTAGQIGRVISGPPLIIF